MYRTHLNNVHSNEQKTDNEIIKKERKDKKKKKREPKKIHTNIEQKTKMN